MFLRNVDAYKRHTRSITGDGILHSRQTEKIHLISYLLSVKCPNLHTVSSFVNDLCCLVDRVFDCSPEVPVSINGVTRYSEK
jgi:hypothetical protein